MMGFKTPLILSPLEFSRLQEFHACFVPAMLATIAPGELRKVALCDQQIGKTAPVPSWLIAASPDLKLLFHLFQLQGAPTLLLKSYAARVKSKLV